MIFCDINERLFFSSQYFSPLSSLPFLPFEHRLCSHKQFLGKSISFTSMSTDNINTYTGTHKMEIVPVAQATWQI